MANSTKDPKKKFRRQGGSNYIAIKDVVGCLDVNDKDNYTIEYLKNKIIITKEVVK